MSVSLSILLFLIAILKVMKKGGPLTSAIAAGQGIKEIRSTAMMVCYRGIHEKDSEDVVSAVCVQRDRSIFYIV